MEKRRLSVASVTVVNVTSGCKHLPLTTMPPLTSEDYAVGIADRLSHQPGNIGGKEAPVDPAAFRWESSFYSLGFPELRKQGATPTTPAKNFHKEIPVFFRIQ